MYVDESDVLYFPKSNSPSVWKTPKSTFWSLAFHSSALPLKLLAGHFPLTIIFLHQVQQKLYSVSSHQLFPSFPSSGVNSLQLSSLLFSWQNFVTSYLHICAIQSLLPGMPPFFIYSLKISSLQGPTSSTATFWGLFDHHCRTWPLPLLSCRICLYKPGETHCLIPYL